MSVNFNRFGVSETIHGLRDVLNQRVDSRLEVEWGLSSCYNFYVPERTGMTRRCGVL